MLVGVLATLLGWLPLPVCAALAWLAGWLWWTLVPVRKARAIENLRIAFPELDAGPTLRRSMRELVLGYLELLHWARGRRLVRFVGWEPLAQRCAEGQGSLFVGGHGGAFELALLSGSKEAGVQASVFARQVQSVEVARLVEGWRALSGLHFLPPSGSMERGYEALEQGRVLVFAMDQRHNAGVAVPFFGRPALTAPSLVAAARRTGLPVFAGWVRRDGLGRHVAQLYGPLPMTGEVEADLLTVNRWLEARIRETPHAWLWLHDRWRTP